MKERHFRRQGSDQDFVHRPTKPVRAWVFRDEQGRLINWLIGRTRDALKRDAMNTWGEVPLAWIAVRVEIREV